MFSQDFIELNEPFLLNCLISPALVYMCVCAYLCVCLYVCVFKGEEVPQKISQNCAAINGNTDVSGIKLHFGNIKDKLRKSSNVRSVSSVNKQPL